MKAWFVSDIHLMGAEDPRLRRFEDFLSARLTDETTHLFLVGDIFDLWVGSDEFFSRRYARVLELIRALGSRGVEINYFEGNHDLHLQEVWADELHCRVFTAPAYFDLGSFRVRVEHGDQMNPDDKGYLLLRAVLRTPAVEWLARKLPGETVQAIGNRMSRSSRKWTSSAMKALDNTAIRKMIQTHAREVFRDDEPFDYIVTGHVHVRDDFAWRDDVTDRNVRSINLGCWLTDEMPKAFCLDDRGGRWVDVIAGKPNLASTLGT